MKTKKEKYTFENDIELQQLMKEEAELEAWFKEYMQGENDKIEASRKARLEMQKKIEEQKQQEGVGEKYNVKKY